MQNEKKIGELYTQAAEHHGAGRFDEALKLYEHLLDAHPRDANILHLKGLAQYQSGDALSAEETMIIGLQIDSSNANHYSNYGAVLSALGRLDEAVNALKKAIELDPQNPEALSNLSALLQQLGRLDDAKSAIQTALEKRPDDPSAINNLGGILKDQGDFPGAEEAFAKALTLNGDLPEPHINLTNLLLQQGRIDEAIDHAEKAVSLAQRHPDSLNILGLAYKASGRLQDSEKVLTEAINIDPTHAQAFNNLGVVLKQMDRIEEAARCFIDAHKASGPSSEINANLAETMVLLGKAEDAKVIAEQSIIINPGYARGWQIMGEALIELGMLGEAIASWEKVLSITPKSATALFCIGEACAKAGEAGMALKYFEKALDCTPENAELHSRMLDLLHLVSEATRESIFEAHRAWSTAHEDTALPRPAITAPNPERPLKVGFVFPSPIPPVLRTFFLDAFDVWERDDWSLTLYDNTVIGTLNNKEAAEKISQDGIDILIDLAGHGKGNRLSIFTHRPAPVQISWSPYPDTTGLKAMDYRIVTDDTSLSSEETIILPSGPHYYVPPADLPEVAKSSAPQDGKITFGYFDSTEKITKNTLETWAEILKGAPKARLLINTPELSIQHVQDRITRYLGDFGIEDTRILYGKGGKRPDILADYSAVHVMLDAFPVSSDLTTCDALVMGVPVITALGDRPCSHTTSSFLQRIDHAELIAEGQKDYVAKAVQLANDSQRLTQYRKTLRQDLVTSSLGDPAQFVTCFADTLRNIWRKACESV